MYVCQITTHLDWARWLRDEIVTYKEAWLSAELFCSYINRLDASHTSYLNLKCCRTTLLIRQQHRPSTSFLDRVLQTQVGQQSRQAPVWKERTSVRWRLGRNSWRRSVVSRYGINSDTGQRWGRKTRHTSGGQCCSCWSEYYTRACTEQQMYLCVCVYER